MSKSRKITKNDKPTVAVLDLDDAAEQFERSLSKAGYRVETVGVKTAELYNHAPHVFVINLSIKGAKKMLRKARKLGSKVVLTADIFETDKIARELEAGSEHFIVQGPGAERELPSLVRKAIRS